METKPRVEAIRERLNPKDPRSVARWAAYRVQESAMEPGRSEDDYDGKLWLRGDLLNGIGYMLTPICEEPKSGMWTFVAMIHLEDAKRIMERGPRGWPTLCRLAETIEITLQSQKLI